MHGSNPPDQLLDFARVDEELERACATVGAAEAHGVICGLLCVPHGIDNPLWLDELAPQHAGADVQVSEEQARRLLVEVATLSAERLSGEAFEFYPLLPADKSPIQIRSRALGEWCTGFLFGLTLAGVGELDGLPDDTREIVTDLSRLAAIRGGAADEEEETAYAELVEYVRVGVMLIGQELGGARLTPGDSEVLH